MGPWDFFFPKKLIVAAPLVMLWRVRLSRQIQNKHKKVASVEVVLASYTEGVAILDRHLSAYAPR